MKRSLLALSALMMTLSFSAFSQECDGDLVVASLTCSTSFNPDVRLYITEFQTCKDGLVVELERSIVGMNVLSHKKLEDIHTINAENISINYNAQRTLIDASNRADFLSFQMPTDAKMIDGDSTIEISVTDKLAPDYRGATTFHYKGSFKMINAFGMVARKGELNCSVNR